MKNRVCDCPNPTGHFPWDLVDALFFGISVYEFGANPTLANAGWLALDTASLFPVLPSVGYLRYGDEGVQLAQRITHVVNRIGIKGGQHMLNTLNKSSDGAKLVRDYLRIADIPGSQKIIKNLATGEGWNALKGYRFELEYAVQNADNIAEIGR